MKKFVIGIDAGVESGDISCAVVAEVLPNGALSVRDIRTWKAKPFDRNITCCFEMSEPDDRA